MTNKPHILCVDDEPKVLEGLALHLRRYYRVSMATNGQAGLDIVDSADPPVVVVSDMRMPEMNGAEFLTLVRERAPTITRLLLTGYADIESAVSAVNHGQVFRFLTKPCSPQAFLAAIQDAVEQYRLIHSERELLEQTLRGSLDAFAELLSLSSPLSFGRSLRIKCHVQDIARAAGIPMTWQLDIAATLSQIGCIALPPATCEKLCYGRPLDAQESELIERVPRIGVQLVENIPRLDAVRSLVENQNRNYDGSSGGLRGEAIPLGARILKLAIDYDFIEASGLSAEACIAALRSHANRYDPALLEAFAQAKATSQEHGLQEVALVDLRPGMVLARDVETKGNFLLVGHGQKVTEGLIQRLRTMGADYLRDPIVIRVPKS